MLSLPVRWIETVNKPGEKYLADLIRGWVKFSRENKPPEECIKDVVQKLQASIIFDYDVDLKGKKALLVEEIVVTGFHMSIAKEVVGKNGMLLRLKLLH